jgi:hypothetical protein
LSARQIAIDRVEVEFQTGRQALQNRHEALAV